MTTVYVTHDQTEAMTLGQRVAVLRDGVLQQCDTPQALFDRPVNLFVAAFIGSPAMNLVQAEIADTTARFAGYSICAAAGLTRGRPDAVGDPGRPSHRLRTADAPRARCPESRSHPRWSRVSVQRAT